MVTKWLYLFLFSLVMAVQVDLPNINFAKADQLTKEVIETYHVPPLNAESSFQKNANQTLYINLYQSFLRQTISKKFSPPSIDYYLPIYSLYKPRDFYLII